MLLRAFANGSFLPITDVGLLQVLFIVFAVISALLLVFVIVLFASAKFRSLLFKTEKKSTKKSPSKKKSTKPVTEPNPITVDEPHRDSAPAEKKSAEKGKTSTRLAYDDAVPTVPLSAPTALGNSGRASSRQSMALGTTPAKPTTYKTSLDHVPTVVLTPSTKTVDTYSSSQKAKTTTTKPLASTTIKPLTSSTKSSATPKTVAITTTKPLPSTTKSQTTAKTASTTAQQKQAAKPVLKFNTTKPTASTQTKSPTTSSPVTKSPITKSPATTRTTARPSTTTKTTAKPTSTTRGNGGTTKK